LIIRLPDNQAVTSFGRAQMFRMKDQLYKLIIHDANRLCYKNCLEYFSEKAAVLDVGIGNGIMIRNFHSLIKDKALRITGIDINKSYLNSCSNLIKAYNLDAYLKIYHEPVEVFAPPRNGYFDYIFFSMSFMLLDNQPLVLARVKRWLKPEGRIVFFQTMFKESARFIDFIKPRLKYVTTIDFGRATYEKEFFDLLRDKGLRIIEDRLLKREWFGGEYRIVVASFHED